MFESFIAFLRETLLNLNLAESDANKFAEGIAFVSLFMLAIISYYITRIVIRRTLYVMIHRSKNNFDDILLKNKVISRASYLVPAYIINSLSPYAIPSYPKLFAFVQESVEVYVIFIVMIIIDGLISSIHEIYNSFEVSKDKPIKGLIQVLKIVLYIVGGLMIIATLIGQNLINLLLGLGTLSAVLMLVFKDPILGFVGGIQLTLNDMVRIGDWISMPKFGADGDVLEITLTTVKVQNWDKTITTIPTYAMVSDYFTNWRGMTESGGRRIKRSVSIDMESVRFCTPEMLEKYSKYQLVKEYLVEKEKEIARFNKSFDIDTTSLVNGRRQTNLGVFRAYLKAYLNNHPRVNTEMTLLVRQLQPSELGIPIEIYVFSANKEWAAYEDLQSDIFDHVLAVVQMFDLSVFQAPSGTAINRLAERLASMKLVDK